MLSTLMILVIAAAASSPLEADFPEGYWDRDFYPQNSSIHMSLATLDPLALKNSIDAFIAENRAKVINFADLTATMKGLDHPGQRARQSYSFSFEVDAKRQHDAVPKLIKLGRLINFNSTVPHLTVNAKDIDERIDWIEKEKKASSAALKTMPVSRAMLESRLKRLRTMKESMGLSKNPTITIQVLKEEPDSSAQGLSLPDLPK